MTTTSNEAQVVKSKSFFTPIRISRMAILIALSVVGAFIKIPTPTGDAGLDSVPAYFAAMMKKWDWKESAIIAVLARLLAAAVVGFPLGIVIQLLLGIANASWVAVVARIARLRFGYIAAIVATEVWAVVISLAAGPALYIIALGMTYEAAFALALAGLPGLMVAAGLAVVIAVAAAKALENTALNK
jgi:riboflavin transporter